MCATQSDYWPITAYLFRDLYIQFKRSFLGTFTLPKQVQIPDMELWIQDLVTIRRSPFTDIDNMKYAGHIAE